MRCKDCITYINCAFKCSVFKKLNLWEYMSDIYNTGIRFSMKWFTKLQCPPVSYLMICVQKVKHTRCKTKIWDTHQEFSLTAWNVQYSQKYCYHSTSKQESPVDNESVSFGSTSARRKSDSELNCWQSSCGWNLWKLHVFSQNLLAYLKIRFVNEET